MNLLILVLYNFAAVGVAVAGLILERRGRPRLGIALLFVALFMILNLAVGGAILFVPVIVALYGTVFGLPVLLIWYVVRRIRRRSSPP
jgi:O-antigen/teichoic acid export membrane protein